MDIDQVISILETEVKGYQVPVVDLIKVQTKDPYKILIATILSARTKDEVTAEASKRLFKVAPNAKQLSKLSVKQIEKIIYPVGFYKNKAKFLKQLNIQNGIPKTIDELTKLPGVGRKTANLVLANAFNIPAIAVDTHVHRITNRWGYVNTKTPLETEFALRKKLPRKHWLKINRILVAFGQNTCKPLKPKCRICPVTIYCEYGKKTNRIK